MDNQLLLPDVQILEGIGFFEGFSHQATLACFSDHLDDNLLEGFYGILEHIDGIDFGLTKIKKHGILVRILGNSGDILEKSLAGLRDEVYNR